jgi:hypothetical protein
VDLDLLVPCVILILLVVYFMFSRTRFEKDIVDLYEEKFEQWKDNSEVSTSSEKIVCKELVGLVYKEEYTIIIELLDSKASTAVTSALKRGKFSIKDK